MAGGGRAELPDDIRKAGIALPPGTATTCRRALSGRTSCGGSTAARARTRTRTGAPGSDGLYYKDRKTVSLQQFPVSYTHLDVYKRQAVIWHSTAICWMVGLLWAPAARIPVQRQENCWPSACAGSGKEKNPARFCKSWRSAAITAVLKGGPLMTG